MKELGEKVQSSKESIMSHIDTEKIKHELSDKVNIVMKKTGMSKKDGNASGEKTTNEKSEPVLTSDVAVKKPIREARTNKAKRAKVKEKPRVIKEKKGYTFAILTKDVTNPRSRKLIKAIQSVLYEYDCMFAICVAEGNAAIEEKYIEAFIEQKVDALIVDSCANAKGIASAMKTANITCVFLHNDEKGLVSLMPDEIHAGEVLGNYTMGLHHLMIRYLGADESLSTAHYVGLKRVYHEKRQPLDYAIKMSDGSHLDTYEKVKEIFEENIDLLILERDEMAIPLNKFLKEYHIAVPQNMSVISYGGHAITQVVSPTLTSLSFDYDAYAQYVCGTLFAILENTKKPIMPEIYHIQEGDSIR